jgi:hypothetical protein
MSEIISAIAVERYYMTNNQAPFLENYSFIYFRHLLIGYFSKNI